MADGTFQTSADICPDSAQMYAHIIGNITAFLAEHPNPVRERVRVVRNGVLYAYETDDGVLRVSPEVWTYLRENYGGRADDSVVQLPFLRGIPIEVCACLPMRLSAFDSPLRVFDLRAF